MSSNFIINADIFTQHKIDKTWMIENLGFIGAVAQRILSQELKMDIDYFKKISEKINVPIQQLISLTQAAKRRTCLLGSNGAFCKNLDKWRLKNGFSMTDLYALLPDIPPHHLYKLNSRKNTLCDDRIEQICKTLELDVNEMVKPVHKIADKQIIPSRANQRVKRAYRQQAKDDELAEIKNEVWRFMLSHNMSVEDVAKLCQCSNSSIYKLLNDNYSRPTKTTMHKVAYALKIPLPNGFQAKPTPPADKKEMLIKLFGLSASDAQEVVNFISFIKTARGM